MNLGTRRDAPQRRGHLAQSRRPRDELQATGGLRALGPPVRRDAGLRRVARVLGNLPSCRRANAATRHELVRPNVPREAAPDVTSVVRGPSQRLLLLHVVQLRAEALPQSLTRRGLAARRHGRRRVQQNRVHPATHGGRSREHQTDDVAGPGESPGNHRPRQDAETRHKGQLKIRSEHASTQELKHAANGAIPLDSLAPRAPRGAKSISNVTTTRPILEHSNKSYQSFRKWTATLSVRVFLPSDWPSLHTARYSARLSENVG